MITTTRGNADLQDVVRILEDQKARAIDLVVPGSQMRFRDGNLIVNGVEHVLDTDGVTNPNGTYRPTVVADEGLAEKLGIPTAFLRSLRSGGRTDLIDANLNGLLRGKFRAGADGMQEIHAPEGRSFLARLFRGDADEQGIMRALLSPRYKVMDSLDALLALLAGIQAAGVNVKPEVDLTDRRMIVRVVAPEITAYASDLLTGYRSPFSGQTGTENPTVFAGLVFSNSEVGNGAWSLTPRMVVQVCTNGMTMTKDAVRSVHLGGAQEDGVVNYSEETQAKALEVVTLKTRDAVKTFLNVDYMRSALDSLTEKAGKPVKGSDAPTVIKTVGTTLGFTKTEQASILDHFLNGGQQTAGGLMQAVTAYVQADEVDADRRLEIEGRATRVLDLV